jgi:cytochrome P450
VRYARTLWAAAAVAARSSTSSTDLVEEFGMQLPGIVMMELRGVPAEDRRTLRRWLQPGSPWFTMRATDVRSRFASAGRPRP